MGCRQQHGGRHVPHAVDTTYRKINAICTHVTLIVNVYLNAGVLGVKGLTTQVHSTKAVAFELNGSAISPDTDEHM
jgi:hypothetical protein